MEARPRSSARFGFPLMQLAAGLAVMLLAFLAVGTVYAQRALPGDTLYRWKRLSENDWRALSPDAVGVDFMLAESRASEVIAVQRDPMLASQALNAYLEGIARLDAELDASNEARILTALNLQSEEWSQSGILLPQLNPEAPRVPEQPTQIPAPTSTATPPVLVETPHWISSRDLKIDPLK